MLNYPTLCLVKLTTYSCYNTGTEVMRNLRSSGNNAVMIGFSGNDMLTEHRDAGAVLSWGKPLPSDLKIKSDLCLALAVRRKLIASGSHESLVEICSRLLEI